MATTEETRAGLARLQLVYPQFSRTGLAGEALRQGLALMLSPSGAMPALPALRKAGGF